MDDLDLDAELMDLLGDDIDSQQIMAIMKSSMIQRAQEQEQQNESLNNPLYRTIDEKDFLEITINSDVAIIHFFSPDFARCKKIDKTFDELSKRYQEASFMRIDAEKAPFFVTKFNIKVLPTVLCFVEGVKMLTLTGFEGLSGDDFSSREMELLLQNKNILSSRMRSTVYTAK